MPSRTPGRLSWFPALLVSSLAAQRLTPLDRELVTAGMWAEARYNYAYWDAVRANWDSAFSATLTYAGGRSTDLQFLRRLMRWGRVLPAGTLDISRAAPTAA